jgi:outer membrane protein
VKFRTLALPALCLLLTAAAFGQAAGGATKIGIIHFQNAMLGTKEGQKAAAELQSKFDPKRKQLEQKQNEIVGLREQYQKTANTASEEVKQKYARDIDQKTKSLQRDTEDAQAEFDQERQRLLNDIGQKLFAVINKYARDNGYTLVLDVSSPEAGVLFAADTTDITQQVIELYDKNAPATPATGGAQPAPGTVAPPASGAKPTPGTVAPPTGGAKPAPGTTAPPAAPPKKP